MERIGLYLHFPFCASKCLYCDFPSCAGRAHQMDAYLSGLWSEMKHRSRQGLAVLADTVFFGGGTPTLFSGPKLAETLKRLKESFPLAANPEITAECNPGTVTFEMLACLRMAGFNRLSIGLQAWQDKHLKALGRIHGRQDFLSAVDAARAAGFDNISADVMYGLPGQTTEEWMETLEKAIASGITHLSAYGLKIEQGTPFEALHQAGRLMLPSEEIEAEMEIQGRMVLAAHGFERYEVSNYAKGGYRCRHNLNYWRNGQYLGLGAGAHSCFHGVRSANEPDIDGYIDALVAGSLPPRKEEAVTSPKAWFETLMLALRLTEGISDELFQTRFGFSVLKRYEKTVHELEALNLIRIEEECMKPTEKGLDLQNQVALAFLCAIER